ncbi:putative methyltransferase DDB_G0268948 [Protopterus annectens]|uniref:putative methyltransferase DDB_G0268948 n=1 Tax=Protopterus annectens TaxID=7888 RepID=UPI001CFB06D0|nr:putative methyltransferase DDB_G0268948 [Protopterus annectens]
MAVRLFEEKAHAACYQRYRLPPAEEVQNVILSYLERKKGKPFQLAVDVGCGTGLSTRVLAVHFQQVVGTDISKAQIEEAKKVPGFPNVMYSIHPAEVIPCEDCSVDLVVAACSVHWFDLDKFMVEVDRVLKQNGCLAMYSYCVQFEVHYKNCSEILTQIYQEAREFLFQYGTEKLKIIQNEYKNIFNTLTCPDKERLDNIHVSYTVTVSELIGLLSSVSMYQTFLRKDASSAKDLLQRTEQRLLETMGVSSNQTQVELKQRYFCVLACKSK